jgi:hypothetical protein
MSTALQNEVLAMLSDGPLTSAEIYQKSELAGVRYDISNALNKLKRLGVVRHDAAHGAWELTGKEADHKFPPPPATHKPAVPASATEQPKPQVPRPRPEQEAVSVPEQPLDSADNDLLIQLLERNAHAARSALEHYIQQLDDSVLEQLLASAGSATDALNEYRGSIGS